MRGTLEYSKTEPKPVVLDNCGANKIHCTTTLQAPLDQPSLVLFNLVIVPAIAIYTHRKLQAPWQHRRWHLCQQCLHSSSTPEIYTTILEQQLPPLAASSRLQLWTGASGSLVALVSHGGTVWSHDLFTLDQEQIPRKLNPRSEHTISYLRI